MHLVIAEKPSVARDLARVLGLKASGRNSLEGAGRVITWCIGHLVELGAPAAYEPRWTAWRMETLPLIPPVFKLRPVARTRAACVRGEHDGWGAYASRRTEAAGHELGGLGMPASRACALARASWETR